MMLEMNMSAHGTIDLAGSSSDEEGIIHHQLPLVGLPPDHRSRAPVVPSEEEPMGRHLLRKKKKPRNKRNNDNTNGGKAAVSSSSSSTDFAAATSRGEGVITGSRTPSSSRSPAMKMKKIQLGAVAPPPPPSSSTSSSVGRTPPPLRSRMNIARREARDRAHRWAECRRRSRATNDGGGGGGGLEEEAKKEEEEGEEEEEEEEVIDLSSPSFPPGDIASARASSSFGLARQSSPSDMGRPSRTVERRQQPRSHLAMSRDAAAAATIAFDGARSESQRQGQWACPRCTLLNDWDHAWCDACQHVNHPDVDDGWFVPGTGRGSSGDRVFSSANLGGASGRGGGISRGTALISNYHDVRGAMDAAGSFHALGYGYRIAGATYNDSRIALGGTVMQPSLSSSAGDGWGRSRRFDPPQNGALLSHLFQAMTYADSGGPRESLDDMSYDRLLQVFGDGGENRGASSETISSLPICTIVDPERELPADKRQCCICLEDFSQGEGRTSLPCLHGFHTGCVNRWLSKNGSCPVCKTYV